MYTDDIPYDVARAAHAGTSFVPEDRAQQERQEYAGTLSADYENLRRLAEAGPTPEASLATLDAEFPSYRARYRKHTLAVLHRRGRCLSSMITGPSNFPTGRNRKALDAEQRSTEQREGFRVRALRAISKAVRPDLAPIRTEDDNAVERLRAKLAKLEQVQERMKQCNAAIRKHAKAGEAAQVTHLVALGLTEARARELLKPDFAGRIGFADFEFKNNGANIRSVQKQIEAVSTAKATPTEQAEGANARLEDNAAENRVRLFFPGKPSAEVRARLKHAGFRWAPSLGCWQAYRNYYSLTTAKTEAGISG